MKAAACVIVIMVHVDSGFQNALQDAIGSFAYVCVTIFFMISAYGMQLSAERKEMYMKTFWRNRLSALMVPMLLVNVVSVVSEFALKGRTDISGLWHLTGYVRVLLMYCVWFYIVTMAMRKVEKRWKTDAVLICGVVAWSLFDYFRFRATGAEVSALQNWCYERYGLVWGLLIYRYMPEVCSWLVRRNVQKVLALGLCSAMLGVAYLKFKHEFFYGEYLLKVALGVTIIAFACAAGRRYRFSNRMNHLLGDISYEVYLSHGMVMGILSTLCPQLSSGVFILLAVALTILLSWGIHGIGSPIVKALRA